MPLSIFSPTGKPDTPYDIRFINATHNSISISWMPGFDGGLMQRFQVRYIKLGDVSHLYADVKGYTNIHTVTGQAEPNIQTLI